MSQKTDNWLSFLQDIGLTQRKFEDLPIQKQQDLKDIFHVMYG